MLEDGGNLSVGGVLLAVISMYLIAGRLLRVYVFDQTGRSVLRPRPVVQVVVLGDIGRSPRMRNHAVSLAEAGCTVDLIGYQETNPGSRVNTNRYIRVRPIRPAWSVPKGYPKWMYLLWAPCKALFVAVQLLWLTGGITQHPNFIFIQNPPAIPTLVILRFVAFVRQSRLFIDWHNFGYTILGMRLGANHPVLRIARAYEQYFGRKAFVHLTVTDRMREELASWGVRGKIVTFKDRPQSHFCRLTDEKMHQFLTSFPLHDKVRHETLDAATFLGPIQKGATLLTQHDGTPRPNRPRLIVSSTSWTEDEDFSLLLDAALLYEERARESDPNLLFVITGKGPLKQFYEEKISTLKLRKTRIITAWLEAFDYPRLLGSADLGISLHTSSSGMDLPMKVVDMFGCGLPVCAVSFECLSELVQDGVNGFVFSTSDELASQLMDAFVNKPDKLLTMQTNVKNQYEDLRWETQWKEVILPLLA